MTATIDPAAIIEAAKPWIILILALLPTLINGLTKYPKLDTFLGKLQSFLGLFSVVVHSDSPGTFKVPLTHSDPPQVIGSSVGPVAIKGPAGFVDREVMAGIVAWGLFMGAALTLLANCAWVQHAKADVVECGKEELVHLEENALADITSILLAGAAGWQAELASIASKVGEDVVGCVVAKLASGWTPPPGTAAAMSPAAIRAYQYLNTQPKKFVL